MDCGSFEFVDVTKLCNNFKMLEDERMKVKVEQCNDDEKLQEEGMGIKVEDCTDEDVIVKVEHDIDEDDKRKSGSDNAVPGPSHKKAKCVEAWKSVQRKKKRDSGESYTSTRGVAMAARKVGAACACPQKCFDLVGREHIDLIFNDYWAMGSHDRQSEYLANHVTSQDVKRSKVKDRPSRKLRRLCYTVKKGNKELEVCRTAFISIHGVSEKRVRNAMDKMGPSGIVEKDKRGKHVPGVNIPANKEKLAREHILSLRTVSSHYTRAKSPNRRYLPPGLNRKIMYDMYEDCGQNKNKNVILSCLRKIHANRLESIQHYFMVPGHSYLPCDRDFGVIELKVRPVSVFTTDHYSELIKKANRVHPFIVIDVTRDFFKDYDVMQKEVSWAGMKAAGLINARVLIYSSNFKAGLHIQQNYGDIVPPKEVNLEKKKDKGKLNLSTFNLPLKYPGTVLLSKEKLADLKVLMTYVNPAYKPFYTTIIEDQEQAGGGQAGRGQGRVGVHPRDDHYLDDDEPDDPAAL
ncbi:hypothetical protein Pmani_005161 [Petrolisthes manimaculis]|uniref:Uncharacterized protein n=1 Tax=Petrolisthes manimaculis TaxID=1843537 RepID=A0AAE1QCZ0_9EUCA|nr:hypothetical protein Pmani_005161 [Petrolisthes manimaculis]